MSNHDDNLTRDELLSLVRQLREDLDLRDQELAWLGEMVLEANRANFLADSDIRSEHKVRLFKELDGKAFDVVRAAVSANQGAAKTRGHAETPQGKAKARVRVQYLSWRKGNSHKGCKSAQDFINEMRAMYNDDVQLELPSDDSTLRRWISTWKKEL